MFPDEMKSALKAESENARVMVDADVLLNEFNRNHKQFRMMILFRDLREIAVSFLMVPICIAMGILLSLPATWYLLIPGLLWIAGFLIWDRRRQAQKMPAVNPPIRQLIESELAEVNHQIWLLRNVHWWYLMPLGVPIIVFFSQTSWSLRAAGWKEAFAFWLMLICFVVILYWIIYWINQVAVRKQLEPRTHELVSLLASLDDGELRANELHVR